MISELNFNETELALFSRQTHFTFGEYHRTVDGNIVAIDKQSCRIFIGSGLLGCNVHNMADALSAWADGAILNVKFKGTAAVTECRMNDCEAAEAVAAILQGYADTTGTASLEDKPEQKDEARCPSEELSVKEGHILNETYSILLNTGRSKAIAYLVSKVGMNVDDARNYVDSLEAPDKVHHAGSAGTKLPALPDNGAMDKHDILDVVKTLRPGDRIHLEFKPLIGKLRVYDTEYLRISVCTYSSQYFSLDHEAEDCHSLMENIFPDLFDCLSISFFCEENTSEISCALKRVKILKKMI